MDENVIQLLEQHTGNLEKILDERTKEVNAETEKTHMMLLLMHPGYFFFIL